MATAVASNLNLYTAPSSSGHSLSYDMKRYINSYDFLAAGILAFLDESDAALKVLILFDYEW